jgi:phosphoglycerol transferase MdoB-like AlkP superfamily enzyme
LLVSSHQKISSNSSVFCCVMISIYNTEMTGQREFFFFFFFFFFFLSLSCTLKICMIARFLMCYEFINTMITLRWMRCVFYVNTCLYFVLSYLICLYIDDGMLPLRCRWEIASPATSGQHFEVCLSCVLLLFICL